MWRIYRLPGSREIWHVDSGPRTQVMNVSGFRFVGAVNVQSVDIGDGVPRAWITVDGNAELHIMQGVAIWSAAAVSDVSDARPVAPVDAAE